MFCKALVSARITFGSPKKTRNEKDVGLKVKGFSKLFLKRFGVWTSYPFCASSSYFLHLWNSKRYCRLAFYASIAMNIVQKKINKWVRYGSMFGDGHAYPILVAYNGCMLPHIIVLVEFPFLTLLITIFGLRFYKSLGVIVIHDN